MKVILTFLLAIVVSGCAYNVKVSSLTDEEKKRLSTIRILDNEPVEKYKSIGNVKGVSCINLGASKDDSNIKEEALDGIKTASAKMHADAVILSDCNHINKIDWGKNCYSTLVCDGKAIKYLNPNTTLHSEAMHKTINGMEFIFGVPENKEYEEIKTIEGTTCNRTQQFDMHSVDDNDALESMREQAIKIGGDAISNVFCQTHSLPGMHTIAVCYSKVKCIGTVIKYH